MTEEEEIAMSKRISDIDKHVHHHLRALSSKLDDHHDILIGHMERFDRHELEDIKRQGQIIESQTLNTKALTDLTASVSGVVEVYNTTHSVGKFIKWISGVVAAIVGLWMYYTKF